MTTAQHQQQFRALPHLFWLAAGVLGGLGLTLRVGRKMLADRFDPNATDVDLRKQLGRELTVNPANGAGAGVNPDAVAVHFSRG